MVIGLVGSSLSRALRVESGTFSNLVPDGFASGR
jgi:hypothetical protein